MQPSTNALPNLRFNVAPRTLQRRKGPTLAAAATAGETPAPLPLGSGHSQAQPYMAKLLRCERVTSVEHWQDTRLVELDIGGAEATRGGLGRHAPGDVLSIQPRNLEGVGREFCRLMGLIADDWVVLQPTAPKWALKLPSCCDEEGRCTILELACSHFDLQGWPKRSFFKQAALLATNPVEAERLRYFSSTEGQRDGHFYATVEQHAVMDALRDFPSVRPDLARLLELIPRLGPRQFSIASAAEAHPGRVQLLIALVAYTTKLNVPKVGVCSAWLASLLPSPASAASAPLVPVWLSEGSLRLPKDPTTPIITVGPGTGVAPFRAFLEYVQWQQQQEGGAARHSVLFYGSRNQRSDFYFGYAHTRHTCTAASVV